MMWQHRHTKTKYSQVSYAGTEANVRSAATGRVYIVPSEAVEYIGDEKDDTKEFYDERIRHLAYQLARELPYNLGIAVVAIAASIDQPEDLLTARAAIRDEQERLREVVADHLITEGAPDDRSDPQLEPGHRPEHFERPDHIDGRVGFLHDLRDFDPAPFGDAERAAEFLEQHGSAGDGEPSGFGDPLIGNDAGHDSV